MYHVSADITPMVSATNDAPPQRRIETTRLAASDRREALRAARVEFRRMFPASAVEVRSAVKIG